MQSQAPALVSLSEACRILGVSRPTLFRRLADGAIPAVQLGPRRYIPRDWLDQLTAVPSTCPSPPPIRELQEAACADSARHRASAYSVRMDFCEAVEYLASKIASEENRGSVMHRAAIAVIEKASEGTFHSEKMACDEALRMLKESA